MTEYKKPIDSYSVHEWFQTQTRGVALETNINEFFGYGFAGSNGNESIRTAIVGFDCQWWQIGFDTDDGNHDAEITLTNRINTNDGTLIITIPASAGASKIISTGSIDTLAQGDLIDLIIEGGGGTGITTDTADVACFRKF